MRMDENRDENTAVFVLGMHRSGTSAISRGLVALGIDWGDNLLGAQSDNAKGFWEDQNLHNINQCILSHSSADSEFAFSLGGRIDFSGLSSRIAEDMKAFLTKRTLQSSLWGGKDPRCCLTFPIWKEQLMEQGIVYKGVMIFRNPLDVALSLQTRNGFSIEQGLMLWFCYNYSILQNASDSIAAIVSYEDLLDQPCLMLEKIAVSLAIDPSSCQEEISEFATVFLNKKLCHHLSRFTEVQKACSKYPEIISFYNGLLDLNRKESIASLEIKKVFNTMNGFGILNKYLYAIPSLELNHIIKSFSINHSTSFNFQVYSDTGNGYSENESVKKIINIKDVENGITFEINDKKFIKKLRIDPCTDQCVIELIKLEVNFFDGTIKEILPTASNAYHVLDNRYFFDTTDPQLYFEVDGKICTTTIYLKILPAIDDDARKVILSSVKQIADVKNLEIERSKIESEHLKKEAEQSRQEAEQSRQEAEQSRQEAEQSRQEAEQSRQEAEQSKQEAEQSKQETEQSKQEAEQSRQEAGQSKQEAEQSKQRVEKLSQTLLQSRRQVEQLRVVVDDCSQQLRYIKLAAFLGVMFRFQRKIGCMIATFIDYKIIKRSELFDMDYYHNQNPDIDNSKSNPLKHFIRNGWKERRNPSASFDTAYYLSRYGDVASLYTNPLIHYIRHGRSEGRYSNIDLENIDLLRNSDLFDTAYYLENNPDVMEASTDAVEHYHYHGWKEGRNPSACFDTDYYLSRYKDVASLHTNPLIHYIRHGKHEQRSPVMPAILLDFSYNNKVKCSQEAVDFWKKSYGSDQECKISVIYDEDAGELCLRNKKSSKTILWSLDCGIPLPHSSIENFEYVNTSKEISYYEFVGFMNDVHNVIRHNGTFNFTINCMLLKSSSLGSRTSSNSLKNPEKMLADYARRNGFVVESHFDGEENKTITLNLKKISSPIPSCLRPLVSVIVPVYCVSQYLTQCLSSLCSQTMREIEIILVDDNSPDTFDQKIIELYQKNDKRIVYIQLEKNRKQGYCRNFGVSKARGEFIAFVDSDDFIVPTMLEKLYCSCKFHGTDVGVCQIMKYSEINDDPNSFIPFTDLPYIRNIENITQGNILSFCESCYNKIYKRELLVSNEIVFTEGLYWEDQEFYWKMMTSVDRVSVVDEYLYYYRERANSTITSNDGKILESIKVLNNIWNFLNENGLVEKYYNMFFMRTVLFIMTYPSIPSKEVRRQYVEALANLLNAIMSYDYSFDMDTSFVEYYCVRYNMENLFQISKLFLESTKTLIEQEIDFWPMIKSESFIKE